ncbi:MAG: DUF3280 domain-containing protein [Paracoccaceae bacterium]
MLRNPRLLVAGAVALCLPAGAASADDPRSVAFLGAAIVNTSPAPTTEAERERLALMEARLAEAFEASEDYVLVDTAPVAEAAAGYVNLAHCNGCDADFAAELGADLAVTAEIQKTSNLILHISVYMRDAGTGTLVGGGSADIRSNTDESWLRGIDYILRNRILSE